MLQRITGLRLEYKFTGGFALVGLLTLAVAIVAISGMRQMIAADARFYEVYLVGVDLTGTMDAAFQESRADLYRGMLLEDRSERSRMFEQMLASRGRVEAASAEYAASMVEAEDSARYDEFRQRWEAHGKLLREVMELAERDVEGALAQAAAQRSVISAVGESLSSLEEYNRSGAEKAAAANAALARRATWQVVAAVTLSLFIAVLLSLFARHMARGIREVSDAAARLARGDLDQDVTFHSRDETGVLADAVRGTTAYLQEVARGAEAIRRGDVDVALQPRSERDVVTQRFQAALATLRSLIAETTELTRAAVAGRLAERADAGRFEGGYHELLGGVNRTLDTFVEPLTALQSGLRRLAARDLSARLAGEFAGDYADVQASFNEAAAALDAALGEVRTSADQVARAGQEITAGSQALASGAGEQAASLEEVSSALQELSSMTRQNAASAQEAQAQMERTRSTVGAGAERVRRLSEAMAGIRRSSEATGKIVKTIDEIAFQTNLLALNAAVEAARAGDAGKGFAVVAEEVRALALRSAEAARNTGALIEEAIRTAGEGAAANEETLHSFTTIQEHVGRVNEVLEEVAAASVQQSEGVAQIHTAVEQMNAATQQVAASSEESASTAEELASQAALLRELVDRFDLSATPARGGRALRVSSAAGVKRAEPAASYRQPPMVLAGAGDDEGVLRGF